jgi:hypothetical protein
MVLINMKGIVDHGVLGAALALIAVKKTSGKKL